MFFVKNVPNTERVVRVVAGTAVIAFGLLGMGHSTMGYVIAAMGAMFCMTGFIGFCPMCAMVGRKLSSK